MLPDRPAAGAADLVRRAAAVLAVLVLLGAGAGAGSAAAVVPSVAQEQSPAGQPPDDTTGEPADADSLPVPEPTTDEADRRADEILADARFQEPPKSLLDRVLEWIVEQLDKIQVPGFGAGAGGGSQIVVWIFVAVLILLAIFLISRTRLTRRVGRDDPDFLVDDEVARTEHEWLAEAERFEAAGQWKQALRCRFRALVATLIERGVVRDIPGRTTGEYRLEVGRNAPGVAPSFAGAAELFDRAWYGDEPTGADENVRFRALADEVVLGVTAEAATPVGAGSAGS